MNYFFITGTSRGIGKALSLRLLEDPGNRVIGISRSKSIVHNHNKHFDFDLSDLNGISKVAEKFFDVDDTPTKAVLVNNAGVLGEVGPFGSVSDKSLIDLYSINCISPAILMNHFIKQFSPLPIEKIVVNISSGAAEKPMDGWGGYCSSKAALNMMSEVADKESHMQKNNVRIFALAPGVVDTSMQGEIRKANKNQFSNIERFLSLKQNNGLSDPNHTAQSINYLINNASTFTGVLQDVRKFEDF